MELELIAIATGGRIVPRFQEVCVLYKTKKINRPFIYLSTTPFPLYMTDYTTTTTAQLNPNPV